MNEYTIGEKIQVIWVGHGQPKPKSWPAEKFTAYVVSIHPTTSNSAKFLVRFKQGSKSVSTMVDGQFVHKYIEKEQQEMTELKIGEIYYPLNVKTGFHHPQKLLAIGNSCVFVSDLAPKDQGEEFVIPKDIFIECFTLRDKLKLILEGQTFVSFAFYYKVIYHDEYRVLYYNVSKSQDKGYLVTMGDFKAGLKNYTLVD